MFTSVALMCLLVAASVALPGGYQQPSYNVPTPYTFNYGVTAGNNNFGQHESGDGRNVRGKYYVHLPDGRVQTVGYWADGSGFHSTVNYQGTASHPGSGYGYH
ncbi:pro-resilin-like [Homarus americanus]|uniref:Pro-resilin-like 48 n=1 Tax=Homarus americanus TaxID=6706 RepID=A0A8J5JH01_HOMAM|nr:pro-resilin-like [Homarus americanus]KAG7158007.1 Pro-resilin-like 48 [Homarus americanus]